MPARQRKNGNELRLKPAKWMVSLQKATRFLARRISKMVEGHHCLLLAINLPMDIIKDSMDSLKEAWSTHKAMVRWATMQTIPTRHMDNKAKFTSNVNTKSGQPTDSLPSRRFSHD